MLIFFTMARFGIVRSSLLGVLEGGNKTVGRLLCVVTKYYNAGADMFLQTKWIEWTMG